jgi:hypothetical protein
MSRPRIQITPHLSHVELTQHYDECQDSTVKAYWQVIQLLSQHDPNLSVEQVADIVGFSTDWVRKLAHRYNRLGSAGLVKGNRALQKRRQKSRSTY